MIGHFKKIYGVKKIRMTFFVSYGGKNLIKPDFFLYNKYAG